MSRLAPLIPLLILISLFVYLQPVPAEDACILLRYATHLAAGHGIVWNVGEDPVEGATEFAWMVLIAGIVRSGLPAEAGTQALGLIFSATGSLLIYSSARRVFRVGILPALFASAAYAASTTVIHAGTGFATPLYTLLVLSSFLLMWRLVTDDTPSSLVEGLLPLCILLAGLTRPEGILFGALLYAGLLVARPGRVTASFVRRQMLFLLLPGAIYYGWRFMYFGFPFPNTYYVKLSDGYINRESATRIFRFAVRFCFIPATLIAAWLLVVERQARRPIAVFTALPFLYMGLYLRFAMIQDVGFRFLFPAFAVLLVLAAPALCALRWSVARVIVGTALVTASVWMIRASDHHGVRDDRYEIGRRLAAFDPRGHVMLPTEAGYLPYLSDWTAIDPLGLNDITVAHEGLTPAYIASRSPDLIMFHVDTAEYRERWTPQGADRWEAMTKMLHAYAREHDYRLVAVIQKSERLADGYHWYFLKPGMADEDSVAAAIVDVADARARGRLSASLHCRDRAR